MSLWNLEGLELGLANSLLWLIYAVVVLERDKLYDTLVCNTWGAATNLSILLRIYFHKKLKERAVVVTFGTFPFVIGALVILQVNPSPKARKILEYIFGNVALGTMFSSHCAQVVPARYRQELLTTAWEQIHEVIDLVSLLHCQNRVMII